MFVSFSTADARKKYLVPKSFSLVGICDFFVESFVHYQDSILGEENRHFAPFCGSIFLFLLASNLVGLIPGNVAITTTIVINLAIALMVFVYFNYLGIKVNGLVGYFRHFAGPIWVLAPLIFGIELFILLLHIHFFQ